MEKVLNEFIEWFNERNSYPIYPSEKDVKMFLSFKTYEPNESETIGNNEQDGKICPVCFGRGYVDTDGFGMLDDCNSCCGTGHI